VDNTAEDKAKDVVLMVGDKTLREHIDPAGASTEQVPPEGHKEPFERQIRKVDASWRAGVDRLDDLPTGEALVDTASDGIAEAEDDKDSRFERLRKQTYEVSDDVLESGRKIADRVQIC